MNKTILKIYAILLLLIAGVINANSVVAFADETSEYVKVFEEHIKAKKSGKYESQDFKKEISVEETGVYTVTVDSPCESYGLSVYNMLDIVDDSNLLIYMTQAYKSQKVYLEKGKTYVLKCRVDYRNLDEFYFKATFKLTDKKEYKAELEVSILKEDSYDFDEMEKTSIKDANIKGVTYDASTRTLTLDNATIKGSIFARRVNPGFGYDYKSVDSDLNIVVKGDNKIVSNGLCGPEQIFTYDTNLNISGGGTLNFVAANTGIRTYDMKIENVTIKGDNFKLLSNKSEMKNLKFYYKKV